MASSAKRFDASEIGDDVDGTDGLRLTKFGL